jgi:hypothetical protein
MGRSLPIHELLHTATRNEGRRLNPHVRKNS